MMTALFALIRKDLILYRSDRRALLLNLMMPIVLGAFFGYLFGGSGSSSKARIDIGLVMQDSSPAATRIEAALNNDAMVATQRMSQAEAQQRVQQGKLIAAIVIPAGFGESAGAALFGSQTKPSITIFYDPSQNSTLPMVKGVLTEHVMEAVSSEMFSGRAGVKSLKQAVARIDQQGQGSQTDAEIALRNLLQSLVTYQSVADKSAPDGRQTIPKLTGVTLPFTTTDQALTSGPSKYNSYAHSFAGLSVQFILFMAIDAGISILLARRQGVWNRMLAAPVTVNTLVLARGISCALIAVSLQCIIFGAAALLFGVRIEGSQAGFLAILGSFSVMTAAFGLLIAAFGKTPEAARGLSVFATLILVMLGGAWIPSFLFPEWLQSVTLILPTRWAIDGLDAMTWRGLDWHAAVIPVAVQLGFAAVFGAAALWKFGVDQYQGIGP